MKDEMSTGLGKVNIYKNVIASIASIATVEIEGVLKIGSSFKSIVYELLGKKNNTAGITINFDKNGSVTIDVPVVIKYGFNLPEVAGRIQENIKSSVERTTDVMIKDINVDIQSVER